MDLPNPQQLRTIQETVIGKLLKGKESATQLVALLKKPRSSGDRGGSVSAEELALQISRSFSESISAFSSLEGKGNGICQIVAADGVVRVSSVDRGSSKTSDNSRKRLGVKDRRGCYRRRNVAQSSIIVSSTVEDGHAWRKYGQKEILNTTYPRCYFRCTHKHDQGCKATKQVQRIKEEPVMYQTTYFGHHTCSDTLMRAPQIISDTDPMDSCLLSFETKAPIKQNLLYPNRVMTTATATGNQEFKDETQSDVSDNKSCLDSSTMLQNPTTNSETSGRRSSNVNGAYHEEVVSGMHSCSSTPLQGLDMEDFSTKFDDLDDHLLFDDMAGLLPALS
ncbi:WRKY DNA-binding transcription factor 70 [Coffea eugenioides]|uniref:WRKY DNA-binding transcription factor 70 n=1 Tax=Coffea eugenioides TaxID=49369 RepID=UPI000F6149DA|nr:WRKY DNA-binding transcription factor 70 [Coffea eugenioides]